MSSVTSPGRSTEPPGTSQLDDGWNAGGERRKSARASLHWAVYLCCSDLKQPIRTKTRDISRDGFYCLVSQPVAPGKWLDCDIVVPTHNSVDSRHVVYLRCRAQVVRVEKTSDEEFGLACRIEDYSVVHGSAE